MEGLSVPTYPSNLSLTSPGTYGSIGCYSCFSTSKGKTSSIVVPRLVVMKDLNYTEPVDIIGGFSVKESVVRISVTGVNRITDPLLDHSHFSPENRSQ